MLPESKKCKKVISWSSDFGMDQYVSLCLPAAEVNLDTICSKYEDFGKPQTNDVCVTFDKRVKYHIVMMLHFTLTLC